MPNERTFDGLFVSHFATRELAEIVAESHPGTVVRDAGDFPGGDPGEDAWNATRWMVGLPAAFE